MGRYSQYQTYPPLFRYRLVEDHQAPENVSQLNLSEHFNLRIKDNNNSLGHLSTNIDHSQVTVDFIAMGDAKSKFRYDITFINNRTTRHWKSPSHGGEN